MRTRLRDVPYNCDGRRDIRYEDHSIFKQDGRLFGNISKRYLDEKNYMMLAHLYILLNYS